MRCTAIAAIVFVVFSLTAGTAAAQSPNGAVNGFGALSLSEASSSRAGFGGGVAINLTPGIQAVGEVGRIGDVLPSITDRLLAFTPIDLRVSAVYGEGGIRVLAAPRSAVNPYVEATAGFARLSMGFSGAGSTADAITNAALGFLNRTEPIAGLGGGILLHGGPLLVDVGYRYKQIFANDSLQSLLSSGNDLHSHQVRFGLGVRF
jgi:hypothetical protein